MQTVTNLNQPEADSEYGRNWFGSFCCRPILRNFHTFHKIFIVTMYNDFGYRISEFCAKALASSEKRVLPICQKTVRLIFESAFFLRLLLADQRNSYGRAHAALSKVQKVILRGIILLNKPLRDKFLLKKNSLKTNSLKNQTPCTIHR